MDRPASTAVVVLLLAVGCRSTAAPADRFELDGKAIRADFFAVEGNGELPVPGDVLKWPLVVIDDVADLVCETVPSNRSYRRTGAGAKLVAIEVAAASDLAVLTDDEAAGLRGIEFVRWDPAMARELRRVDARRCMFTFGPFSDVVDLLALPTTTRYLHMQDAKPVDPAGFARFPELRYLAVPNEAFVPDGEPPPALEDDSSPGPAIAVDWTCVLPELRWLDLECVGADLRPLAGHPRLRTVLAAHCRIEKMPTECMPALREFLAPFSDCPAAEVERMRRLHPAARIRTTPREVLLDCISAATCVQLRTGASCHPRPSDRVVYTTRERSEIEELIDLLQPQGGYGHKWPIFACDCGVIQFLDDNGSLIAEVGMIGTKALRSYRAWGTTPSFLGSNEKADALRGWLAARRLQIPGARRPDSAALR